MSRELADQILYLNHREFTIQEVIGRGASCVVYRAVCPDNTEHLIKEYNPRHIAMYREDNGKLCLESEENQETFEAGLARFRKGHTLQKQLRLDSDLKNSTSNIQEIYSANGTEYIDMTCFAGQSYEKVRENSVYDLMRRMKALTRVVGNYHKAGLLHLDIKPHNIFTIPETCELVMLFDFDSVVTKETAAMGGAHSYSKDWSAPEQRNPLKRRNVCEATDLFAVGEIIFWQLMGRNSTAEDHRSFAAYTFEHGAPIFENINPKVFPFLDELLHHTICTPIDQRYQSAEELITKLDAIIKIADPKEPYLKSSAMSMQNFFIGRDSEIQEIHEKLSENRILFLSGIGGVGKSELAKHYAEAYRSSYDTILFAPYVSDVNMLIADDIAIPIFNFQPYPEEKPQDYCDRKMRKLRELCDERTLLIVDNLDSDEDPDIPKLLELGCKLLITTRMDFSDYGIGQFLYIEALRNKSEIRDIFDKYYTKPLSAEEESCVEQIIDLVAGHTMAVELLAKQMMAGRVKPNVMLAKLQKGGISESGKEKVRSGKDGALSTQNTFEHIQTLFDLSALNDEEKYIIANLALVPLSGISTDLLSLWCELQDYTCVNELVTVGWIRLDEKFDRLSMHPIVSDIGLSLVKNDTKICNVLLRNAMLICEDDTAFLRADTQSSALYAEMCMVISQKIVKLGLESYIAADFLNKIPRVFWRFGYLKEATICYARALNIYLEKEDEAKVRASVAQCNLGTMYLEQSLYDEAEKCLNEAIKAQRNIFQQNTVEVADTLYQLGRLYLEQNHFDLAEPCFTESLHTYQNIYGNINAKVGYVDNDLGMLFWLKSNFEMSQRYYLESISIGIQVHGENSSDVASGYINLGILYHDYGLLNEAKTYYDMAYNICLHLYGSRHRLTASVVNCLGELYRARGDYSQAEFFLTKALQFFQCYFGDDHDETANSYNNIGALYRDQANYAKAEEYYAKALAIWSKIHGNTHGYVAIALGNLSATYREWGNLELSKEYAQKALILRKKLYGNIHLDTALSYYSLGLLAEKEGDKETAISNYQLALSIRKKLLGADHSETVAIKKRIVCLVDSEEI